MTWQSQDYDSVKYPRPWAERLKHSSTVRSTKTTKHNANWGQDFRKEVGGIQSTQ